MVEKVIASASKPDDIQTRHYFAKMTLTNGGLKVDDVKAIDLEKFRMEMDKTKSPLEFVLSYDGSIIEYSLRVGSTKKSIYQLLFSSVTDNTQRAKIVGLLTRFGLMGIRAAGVTAPKRPR